MLTTQVADWYVMTDELLYERLALSVTQLHSPLPHVHGELIGNINQLYPLLLAPLLAGRLVPHGLHDAHVLNALVMSSACIPAALLARRVTGSTRLAYVVGVLTVCMPWIALSSFLMTEVRRVSSVRLGVARTAQRSRVAAAPERPAPARRDRCRDPCAHAVRGAAAIVPLALLLDRFRTRVLVAQHRVLAGAYVALLLATIVCCRRRLSHALGHLFGHGGRKSDAARDAPLAARASGADRARNRNPPFILAVAWPLTALVRERTQRPARLRKYRYGHIVALLFEVTSYDLRFGQGRLHDRYLFYLVPLLLISCTAMVRERDWPRWAVFAAGASSRWRSPSCRSSATTSSTWIRPSRCSTSRFSASAARSTARSAARHS